MEGKFRSEVFKRAWNMFRETGKSFRICLVKAWEVYRLKKPLTRETLKFAYEKVNGTLRYATGTLQSSFLSAIKGARKPNLRTLAYYDLEMEAIRCFRIENLVRIYA